MHVESGEKETRDETVRLNVREREERNKGQEIENRSEVEPVILTP